jgi:hypothetical protein
MANTLKGHHFGRESSPIHFHFPRAQLVSLGVCLAEAKGILVARERISNKSILPTSRLSTLNSPQNLGSDILSH